MNSRKSNIRILVTGAAGFIGSELCRYLVTQKCWTILNVDMLTYAANIASLNLITRNPLYHFVQADICDRKRMDQLLCDFAPDAVMHLAAESHVDRSIVSSAEFIRSNVCGTHTLLEASLAYWQGLSIDRRGRFRFLHISTDEVFGSLGAEGLLDEYSRYDPHSPYSASKAASDHLVRAWHYTYELPTLISNCSNNYGPFHFPEKLIPLTIINALEGKSLPLYGDGGNIRDWLYVTDHVRALELILTKGRVGESYNVGGRCERTNLQVVHAICEILDDVMPTNRSRHSLITFVTDRPGHDQRYAIDSTKIEGELGWLPLESFESGLRKTVLWYMHNPQWWRPIRERVYGGERLGLLNV